jgi:hypothetical protein
MKKIMLPHVETKIKNTDLDLSGWKCLRILITIREARKSGVIVAKSKPTLVRDRCAYSQA